MSAAVLAPKRVTTSPSIGQLAHVHCTWSTQSLHAVAEIKTEMRLRGENIPVGSDPLARGCMT